MAGACVLGVRWMDAGDMVVCTVGDEPMSDVQARLFDAVETPYGVDFRTIARRTDPQTSQTAAGQASSKSVKLQLIFVEVLKSAKRPLTAMEVATLACPDNHAGRESIRKRAGELVGKSIEVHDQRKCSVTGKLARTFVVKE